ncbi:hypothetical protein SAMN05443668_104475 [Cryptosporangium aurantiacum]|uniref:AAA+ ATPase domain-containing protein n=1 Tax=Cryptosporangium aurantiacum TaxID=134849 RepID=A0A1M7QDD4_9ACTN|nr:hypothetical protein SAMN05443668_104475 [Cryptosporangium aurantiacum]
MLGESTETRRELRAWGSDLLGAAHRATDRLDAIERLLNEVIRTPSPARSTLDVLGRLNRSILERPVLGDPTLHADEHATLPTVEQAYITPRLRVAVADRSARPSDERWWAEQPLVADTELFLAGYLCSPESAGSPLLVLGLPGAGKSMLTQMLAARLPVSGWTPVRVPLRHVRADAAVSTQIQEALDSEGHGRLRWPHIADDAEAAGTTRVVVLDGLDELMQASGASQSRYLFEVAEFQDREAAMGRPVATVVTSRTVMADRVQIPPGTIIVRLEGFDDAQVERWVAIWNALNHPRSFRALPPPSELPAGLAELTRQPLLLLLVALYTADPDAPPLTAGVTTVALYDQLITHFLRREALKESGRDLSPETLMADRRRSLTLAAFAMVNRGRPYATGPELERDLGAFLGASPSRAHELQEPLDHTVRTVGRFFFVHASGERQGGSHELPPTYEFLHSTFGEYLVAAHLAAQLQFLRQAYAQASGLGFAAAPDSNGLRALLSHEPLLKFPRVLELIGEVCSDVSDVLRALVAGARNQLGPWTPAAYNPSGRDTIDHYAIYTLNLVSLLAQLESPVPVSSFAPAGVDTGQWWRSLVRQWRAGLDDEAWLAVAGSLTIRPGWVLERASSRGHLGTRPADWAARGEARLLGDLRVDAHLSAGAAAWRGTIPDDPEVAAVFAGLVEMQLHGVVQPRTLRAAVRLIDENPTAPTVLFDLLLTVVTRTSVWLTLIAPHAATIDRERVLALIAHQVWAWGQYRAAIGEPDPDEVTGQTWFEVGIEAILPVDRPFDTEAYFLAATDPATASFRLTSGWEGLPGSIVNPHPFHFGTRGPDEDRYRGGDSVPSVDAAAATVPLTVHFPEDEDMTAWNTLVADVVALARRRRLARRTRFPSDDADA